MSFRTLLLVSSPLLATLALACGSNVAVSTGGSGTGAGTTSTGNGGTSAAACPPTPQAAGTSCSHEGANCTWGNEILAECRTALSCTMGKWVGSTLLCPMPTGCPASQPQEQASCSAMLSPCPYPNGAVCACAPCPPFGGLCMPGPLEWYCQAPSGSPGCPTLIPNEGSACSSAGATCNYPSESCGMIATCSGGVWAWSAQLCPG